MSLGGRRASGFGPSLSRGVQSKSHKSYTSKSSWSEAYSAMDFDNRLSYQGSRGFDERSTVREREGRDEEKLKSEAQRLAAAYFASQGVTPDQLGTGSSEGSGLRGDGSVRGTEGYSSYRGLERDKSKPYLDRGVVTEGSLGFDTLARRSVGEEGRGKPSFLRYEEPEYTYSDLKPPSYVSSSGQVFGKGQYDDYARETRPRDTRPEFMGSSRHERDVEAYGKESYDPFRAARRGRRREGLEYEAGRKYSEDGKGDEAYSVRGGESLLGKRKSKSYDGGSKDYYADKKPAYLTALEAEALQRPKGDMDLGLDEYDYQEFGRQKGEGQEGAGGLIDHGGNRSILQSEYLDKGARKERDNGRVVKSEIYDRRSSLSESVGSERDSERAFLSSRGRRGRRPSSRGSYSGDYHDGSDSAQGLSSRSRFLEERLGETLKYGPGKSDYRYSASHSSLLLGRDPVDGYRQRSYESALDKPFESPMELERLQSPLAYDLGNGSWRSRSGDIGGRSHDLVERAARDKLAFLHQSDTGPAFFASRGGPRSGFSKHRGAPDFRDRDLWLPGFRGGRRGRGRGRMGGMSHADELFRMHNMKAKTWSEKAGEDHAEPRYRGFKRHSHRSPHSQEHKESSKESDWDAVGAEHVDATGESKKPKSPEENGIEPAVGQDKSVPAENIETVADAAGESVRTPLREAGSENVESRAAEEVISIDLNISTESDGNLNELDDAEPSVRLLDEKTIKEDPNQLVVEGLLETSSSMVSGTLKDQNSIAETRAREDRAYELYTKLFEENVTLRKMYEEQLNSGSFDCLVCFDSGSGQATFPDLASLLQHAHSTLNSNKDPEHHGYGRAVAYLLGLSVGGITVVVPAAERCEPKLEPEQALTEETMPTEELKDDLQLQLVNHGQSGHLEELLEA